MSDPTSPALGNEDRKDIRGNRALLLGGSSARHSFMGKYCPPPSIRKASLGNVSGMDFRQRYGPWALITGASAGLGACYAHALGARGLGLVLVARRQQRMPRQSACSMVRIYLAGTSTCHSGTRTRMPRQHSSSVTATW